MKNQLFVIYFSLFFYSNFALATADECRLSFNSKIESKRLIFSGKTEYEANEFRLVDDDGLLTLASVTKKIYNESMRDDGSFSDQLKVSKYELDLVKLAAKENLKYLQNLEKVILSSKEPDIGAISEVSKDILDSEKLNKYIKSLNKLRVPINDWVQNVGIFLESTIKAGRKYPNLNAEPRTISSGCGGGQIVVPSDSELCLSGRRRSREGLRCGREEAKKLIPPPMVLSMAVLCNGGYENPKEKLDSNFCVRINDQKLTTPSFQGSPDAVQE